MATAAGSFQPVGVTMGNDRRRPGPPSFIMPSAQIKHKVERVASGQGARHGIALNKRCECMPGNRTVLNSRNETVKHADRIHFMTGSSAARLRPV